jgi:hypothetical protein
VKQEETRVPGGAGFHYSREERLAGTNLGKREEPKGLFRRNRSLAIILLDVLLILLIYVLFQFVFTPGRSRARVGDYDLTLSAFRFESEIYASVEIVRARSNEPVPQGEASLVQVTFGPDEVVLDALPLVPDEPITVSAVLDAAESDGDIAVDALLLGEEATLRTSPRK